MSTGEGESSDGRRARVEAGKTKAIRAAIELGLDDGQNITFKAVAARAGISQRSVERYFRNIDGLIEEGRRYLTTNVAPVFPVEPPPLPFIDRPGRMVQTRIDLIDRFGKYFLAMERLAPNYPAARGALTLRDEVLSEQFTRWFDDIKESVPEHRWILVEVLMAYESLRLLHSQLGDQTREAVVSAVLTLLGEDADRPR